MEGLGAVRKKWAVCLAGGLLLGACASGVPHPSQQSPVAVEPVTGHASDNGRLRFLGRVELRSRDARLGGLSGLRWRDGALMAVTDAGNWVSLGVRETDNRLIGVHSLKIGALHGLKGEVLEGKDSGDAEALTIAGNGDWLVAFERDHRIWRYPAIDGPAQVVEIQPEEILGKLAANNGLEAMAGTEADMLMCPEAIDWIFVECRLVKDGEGLGLHIAPPSPLNGLGGVPTDADRRADGTYFVLFRSYSPADGARAAIVEVIPGGGVVYLAVFGPADGIDNMEGLAVREVGGRTFFYLVSDDNFSSKQKTLLLKFELLPAP